MPKLTPWFPGHVKPVRKGLYQQHSPSGFLGYQYWDGKSWYGWSEEKSGAKHLHEIGRVVAACFANDPWRGLTKDAK